MSSIMSLKTIKNKPHRSAFDLSMRKLFTAKVGEVLPVYFKEVIPGDKFKLGLQSFTRTQPVNSAAYTRIKEYYDYFFVPYRLLWRYFDQFITQTEGSNPQFANSLQQSALSSNRLPYVISSDILAYLNHTLYNADNDNPDARKENSYKTYPNEFGFGRAALSYKLLKMLGYGFINDQSHGSSPVPTVFGTYNETVTPFAMNVFPLLAYQKICQDYFRNQQWEKSNPTLYNVDYLNGSNTRLDIKTAYTKDFIKSNKTIFDLQYCTWNKDLFTGVLPSPQFGDTATISQGQLGDVTGDFTPRDGSQLSVKNGEFRSFRVDNNSGVADFGAGGFELSEPSTIQGWFNFNQAEISKFSVLALRQAEALQKWKEISISGKQDYKDQIEKHFGVRVSDTRSNLSTWIGGCSSNLDISEVVNTNLATMNQKDGSKAGIAGKGVGVLTGRDKFEATEHGILMCIYHAVPLMDYQDTVTDLYMFKSTPFDFAIPELDSIGMQSLPGVALSPSFGASIQMKDPTTQSLLTTDSFNSLGYVPRYIDYKTSIDTVSGAFADTLRYWCAPLSVEYFQSLAYPLNRKLPVSFFKCNPSILDTIFAVSANEKNSSDTFLINSYHDIKAVRNLDYNGLPY